MASQTRTRRAAPKRAPARKATARTTARRSSARRSGPLLSARQAAELVGLALVVLGVFAALVLWLDVDGAAAGHAVGTGLRALLGRLAVIAPPAIVGAGALVLSPSLRRLDLRAPLAGGLLLVAAALLLVATDDLSGAAARRHGGLVGGALHAAVSAVAGGVGVVLLALFLGVAGLLLLTGASVASAGGVVRRELARTGEALRALRPVGHSGSDDDPEEADGETRSRTPETGGDAGDGPPADEPAAARGGRGRRAKPFDLGAFPEVFVREEPESLPAAVTPASAPPPAAEADPPPWDEDVPSEALDAEGEALGVDEDEARPSTDEYEIPAAPAPTPSLYRLPDADVLHRSSPVAPTSSAGEERVAQALVEALSSHGVQARIIGTVSGPRVTRYELQLAPGTKVGRVAALKDDLAYALATTEIRILAPIPGKQAVGVEVPNLSPNVVTLGDISGPFPAGSSPLTVWLGKDIAGQPVHADLARMPHLLVAGTTGSGKSGCLNAMLVSILLNATPEEARLILIDPKKVELNHYEAIPHLLTPVVTNMKGAAAVLLNIVGEMERRYEIMSTARARNIAELNRMRREAERETLPYILVVIDELADLMMVSPTEVEDAIIRLAQKSRAVGIHLVLATQRPSVDVITGMIKANVPSRIAFAVSGMVDSRVILDTPGAESLLGQGDMLYRGPGTSRLQRVQGAFVTEEEIAMVVEQCRRQGEPEFEEDLLELPEIVASDDPRGEAELSPDEDPLLDEAIKVVVNHETASVSLIQRRLRVGYTRAGRLIDMLERRGVISGYEGSKPRQVLVTEADLPRLLAAGPAAVGTEE